jgi:hypothetical protein
MSPKAGVGCVAVCAALASAALATFAPERALAVCTTFAPHELRFQSGKTQVRARPYGRIARVVGRVTCEDGTQVASGGIVGMAAYMVLSNGQLINSGGDFAGVQPDGTFTLTVDAGPSRRLYFAFSPPDGSYVHYNPGYLTFICRVRPRLHVRPKVRKVGKSVRFTGSLPGPFLAGRPAIAMQARTGHKWRTFKVVPLNPAGKFKAKYRFARTSRTTIYHFRAKPITGSVEYPFQARASRQKKAIVHA